jgi:hypothetical protein
MNIQCNKKLTKVPLKTVIKQESQMEENIWVPLLLIHQRGAQIRPSLRMSKNLHCRIILFIKIKTMILKRCLYLQKI